MSLDPGTIAGSCAAFAGFLALLGVAVMQIQPCRESECRIARFCFVLSAIAFEVAVIIFTLALPVAVSSRVAIIGITSIAILSAWFYSNRWLRERSCAVNARGDLLLTIRSFDYDEMDNQLCATLTFYNNDSIPRNILGVRFLYRPTSHAKGFQMYDTGPRDTLWEGHFDPVKLQPGTEETKRYRSVPPPKISPEIIDRPGSQFGLYISFTNAKRQTDHAVLIAMEVPTLPVVFAPAITPTPLVVQVRARSASRTLVSRSWPVIENLSLDSIRDSLQIDEAVRTWRALQQTQPWYRSILSRYADY